MIKYVFRNEEPVRIKAASKANPQAIGEALEAVAAKANGELTPGDVVNAARSKKSVLHPHFEWDDALAAEAHRLDQARNLVRLICVEDESTQEGTTRAFQSIDIGAGRGYRHIDAVRASADFQMALLAGAERDLQAFERRYRELADVCKFVEQARQAVAAKRGTIESRAAA
jgi:hypothetical protein